MVSWTQVDAADNIDLVRIVQEFEESYEVRYNRRPKLVKRLVEEVPSGGGGVRQVAAGGAGGAVRPAAVRMPSPSSDRPAGPAPG